MKAYQVIDYNWKCHPVIVFAESQSKAKAIAHDTQELWNASYTELRANRIPKLDCYFDGRLYLNFNIPKDREILVNELDWVCDAIYEDGVYDYDAYECKDCLAKEHCSKYWDHQEEYKKFEVCGDE